jgi:hypothetical protein
MKVDFRNFYNHELFLNNGKKRIDENIRKKEKKHAELKMVIENKLGKLAWNLHMILLSSLFFRALVGLEVMATAVAAAARAIARPPRLAAPEMFWLLQGPRRSAGRRESTPVAQPGYEGMMIGVA